MTRRTHTTLGRTSAALLVGLALAAWPAARARVEAAGATQGSGGPEITDRATRVLALGPTGSLELKTISGDISIMAGPGREAHVEIIRRSRGRTRDDARQGLQDVTVAVDHQGERATVTAVYGRHGGNRPYQVSVDYVVTAPAGTRVTASTISGTLTARDMTGDLSALTTSGDITISGARQVSMARSISGDVTLTNIATDGGLTVGTISGDVKLDDLKARRLEVETTSGDVSSTNVVCDRAALHSLSGSVTYVGSVARGGRYDFQSHSGEVRIVAVGSSGFELQASSFSGSIRPERGLTLRGVSTTSRSLRATVGDGGGLVVATTFSGDVTIGSRR